MAASGGNAATGGDGGNSDIRFLVPPYPSGNMQISEDRESVIRVNNFGSRIVYFDRGLGVDDELSIGVLRYEPPLNDVRLEFGVTTCDIDKIMKYKTHVKSVCDRDGRPCGGRSLTIALSHPDIGRGKTIFFHRSREDVIDVIFHDGRFIQMKDTKRIFRNRSAFPFLMLTGDVANVQISGGLIAPEKTCLFVNQGKKNRKKKKSGEEAANHVPDEQTSPSVKSEPTSIASSFMAGTHSDMSDVEEPILLRSKEQFFMMTAYPNEMVELAGDSKIVRRSSGFPGFVYLNRCLDVGDEINLRVKKVRNVQVNYSFRIGFSTCNFDSIFTNECHANEFCSDTSPCDGDSFHIEVKDLSTATTVKITRKADTITVWEKSMKKMYVKEIPDKFKSDYLRPFLILSGTADTIHLTEPEVGTRYKPSVLPEASSSSESDVESVTNVPLYRSRNASSTVTESGNDQGPFFLPQLPPPQQQQQTQPKLFQQTLRQLLKLDVSDEVTNPDIQSHSTSCDYDSDYGCEMNGNAAHLVPNPTNGASTPRVHDQDLQFHESPAETVPNVSPTSSPDGREWFSNQFISSSGPFITRVGPHIGTNYIFSTEMRVNDTIVFRVSEQETGIQSHSLRFGLTINHHEVDVCSLPADPDKLSKRLDRSLWFLSSELTKIIGIFDEVFIIRRTATGVVLGIESDSRASRDLITDIPPDETVFPFFFMSGSVKSVEFLPEPKVEPLCYRDRLRLYLTFIYLSILNRQAIK